MILSYQDTATFYKVTSSGYGNTKVVEEVDDIPVIFLQGTGFIRSNNQEQIDSDAICYPDPTHSFVVSNHMRLEGMYILAPLFSVDSEDGWYKVTKCIINRDHLLGNEIDNIQLLLKKTTRLPNVS